MKVRLKFRNNFHVHDVGDKDTKLLGLLQTASHVFKIDLPNVQISLNANDYVGIAESNTSLGTIGIVSGDIVYVRSLESLDDICRSMQTELSNSIDSLYHLFGAPQHTVLSVTVLPLYLCATQKRLTCIDSVPACLADRRDCMRLQFVYESTPVTHVNFSLYLTGNFICIAATTTELNVARQLLLPIRDHMLYPSLFYQETVPLPSLVFKHLRTLCNRIKDELLEPILVSIHTTLGMPSRTALETLPHEVLVPVLLYLPLQSLGNLMLCSTALYRRVKCCAPVWRLQLARLNAKTQPLLAAALTRLHNQQRQSPPDQRNIPEPTGSLTDSNVPSEEQIILEDNLSDVERTDRVTQDYERFSARYRNLMFQRKRRSMRQRHT